MTCSIVPVVDSCCHRCMDWSTSHAPLLQIIFLHPRIPPAPPPPPKKLYIFGSFAETFTFVLTHRHRLHLSRPLHQALHVGQHARQPRRLLARDGLERVGHRLVLADQLGRLFQPRVRNKIERKKSQRRNLFTLETGLRGDVVHTSTLEKNGTPTLLHLGRPFQSHVVGGFLLSLPSNSMLRETERGREKDRA